MKLALEKRTAERFAVIDRTHRTRATTLDDLIAKTEALTFTFRDEKGAEIRKLEIKKKRAAVGEVTR